MNGLIECIPNFSEGRNLEIIEGLARLAKDQKDVYLLDYSADYDHNRSVFTLVGSIEGIKKALFLMSEYAIKHIDLNHHQGVHPRMGAVDVIPIVALDKDLEDDAIKMSKELAYDIAYKLNMPTYLYEKSCINENHRYLQDLRRGQFEGLEEKQKDPKWTPDYGQGYHKTAGVCAIGVRDALIAYNVILDSNDLKVAYKIAKQIRFSNGGMPCLKAIGVKLESVGKVQVSMNLVNYHVTGVMDAYKAIEALCKLENTNILYSELIGLMPKDAINKIDFDYIKLKDYNINKQVIEYCLNEVRKEN